MSAPVTPLTLEERVAALEREVVRLQGLLESMGKPQENWLERISGSMRDVPPEVWQEFQECCKEIRDADRPADNVS